ncbi:MAG TPA: hypothetical protein VFQ00_12750 [Terriglobales bacterium]|nr:hypothetical protein [Terriglobales bacterium]
MLWIPVVVFFILWILGLAGVYTIGGWDWVFFVAWIVFLIVQVAAQRNAAKKTLPGA